MHSNYRYIFSLGRTKVMTGFIKCDSVCDRHMNKEAAQ